MNRKYLDQEHLEKIIGSLSEDQFRRFIKEYLRAFYKTKEVDVTDGTNDGGNDIHVFVNNNRIKKSFQITVQDNINKKIIEDIEKAKYNVEKFGFQPNLLFFYSHTVSGEKKDNFAHLAEVKYDITLRIYDRKSLASYVDQYPTLEAILKEMLTGLKEKTPRINPKNKIIFDMLTSGGIVNDIKSEFIRTVAQYYIFEQGPQPIQKVVEYVNSQLNCKIDSSYFSQLINRHDSGLSLQKDGLCDITQAQRERIIAIKVETSVIQDSIITKLHEVCLQYNMDTPSAEKIFKIISAAYIRTSDIEAENLSSKTNANDEAIDKIINALKHQINTNKLSADSDTIINELLSITVGNEYFAKLATTQLFSNLFKQNELEEYLSLIPKNVYLDTQILLQIICCLFEDSDYSDFQYISAKTMLRNISNSRCRITLYTLQDYIEEVCVHLWDGFAVSEIERYLDFSDFGKSNNIFYCYFRYLTDNGIKNYELYSDFISDLIGVDIYSNVSRQDFINEAVTAISYILTMQDITVVDSPYIVYDELDRLTKEYDLIAQLYRRKPHRAIISDIKMIQYLSDKNAHINQDTQLPEEPYFITCDSSLYNYRHHFIARYPKRLHWYIYTPLKFANRLSVMNFKPDPEALSLDLINVAEANFNSSTTNNKKPFIDILSMFVGKTNENSWAITRRLAELNRMNQDCSSNVDFSKVKQTEHIESVLTRMAFHYSKPDSTFNMEQLINLIEDDRYAPQFDRFIEESIKLLEQEERIDYSYLDSVLKARQESN